MKKKRPISIENRWDILYRDYPEVYDKFSSFPYNPTWHESISKKFNLKDKTILDIGSGSGKSTFGLVRYCKYVIGVEPEDAMRKLAIKNAKKDKIKNVEFRKGSATKITADDNSVDAVVGITMVGINTAEEIKKFVDEASRVIKKGGYIIMVNIAPGWYGGNLEKYISDNSDYRKESWDKKIDNMFGKFGFKKKDIYSVQDYGNVDNLVETYGFIHGKNVIEHIKKNNISKIKWKLRARYKRV